MSSKLYFKYGAMGSSKTVGALTTRFNYQEWGNTVWLIKPGLDNRDGREIVKSRIGLGEKADHVIEKTDNIYNIFKNLSEKPYVIVADEAQFFTEIQIEQLRKIVDLEDIDVICYGLKNDFQTKMFPGSKRLFELSESVNEIKTICSCGTKASVNARFDQDGQIVIDGDQVEIGGNDKYRAVCYQCYRKMIEELSSKKPV